MKVGENWHIGNPYLTPPCIECTEIVDKSRYLREWWSVEPINYKENGEETNLYTEIVDSVEYWCWWREDSNRIWGRKGKGASNKEDFSLMCTRVQDEGELKN